MNKYAIVGKYFNFSTAGQRLWDEFSISIPPGIELDAAVLDRIREKVGSETRAHAEDAEREWSGIAQANGISEFGVTPFVGLRPSLTGRDLVIRYITNARSRFATRVELQHELFAILQSTAQELHQMHGAANALRLAIARHRL